MLRFSNSRKVCLMLRGFGGGKGLSSTVIYGLFSVKFLGFFVVSIAVITIFFQVFTFGLYGQIIGYLSMSIEATLGLPQLISNYRTKSV